MEINIISDKKILGTMIEKLGEGTYGNVYATSLNNAYKEYKKEYIEHRGRKELSICIIRELTNNIYLRDIDNVVGIENIYMNETIGFTMKKYDTNLAESIHLVGSNEKMMNDIIFKIVKVLADAQNKLVLHRDIKPSNILINNDGTIGVCDWGLSLPKYSIKLYLIILL